MTRAGLAMSLAFSVTGLPTTAPAVDYSGSNGTGTFLVSCLAVDQAREAIAFWLAASATPSARGMFAAPPGYPGAARVGIRWLATYDEYGSGPSLNLVVTAEGALFAPAMLRLPDRQIEAVLAERWPGWLRPRAADAQLAAALGRPAPAAPAPPRCMIGPGQSPPSPAGRRAWPTCCRPPLSTRPLCSDIPGKSRSGGGSRSQP